MTVMLYSLAEIRVEMTALEMGVQVMILPTTSFGTMNASPYWCFESSPAVPVLLSLVRGSFSETCQSDLSKAQNVPSITHGQLLYFFAGT